MLGSRGGAGGLYSARAPGGQEAPSSQHRLAIVGCTRRKGHPQSPCCRAGGSPRAGTQVQGTRAGEWLSPSGAGTLPVSSVLPLGGGGVLLAQGALSPGPRVPSPSSSPSLSRAIRHPSPSPCLARAWATCCPRGAQGEEHNDIRGQQGHGRGHPPG